MKSFFRSTVWKIGWRMAAFLILISLIIAFMLLFDGYGMAEDETESVWVMCSSESFVCVREKPKKTSYAFGGATCGTMFQTDGKSKGDFIHVVNVPAEESEGWISSQYIVHSEPIRIDQSATVVSNGRLAARKGINGKVQYWLEPMSQVTIFWWTDEWCLTNKGYVATEFLELDGEN